MGGGGEQFSWKDGWAGFDASDEVEERLHVQLVEHTSGPELNWTQARAGTNCQAKQKASTVEV